jgi:acyl dehydratase
MTTLDGYSFATVKEFIGREFGVSDWITVDQETINKFAESTGDDQWIHVDVERAKRESPYGTTIAHGFPHPLAFGEAAVRRGCRAARRRPGDQLRA